ncbi:hypothetical protein ACQP0C_21370 [Nocardia sp. CA-129566]|uniref:hypothetical protein n=1 Tax=Nocardia sp. CA-129566 TaxID=3239976 RepID=UPI003D98EBB3
MASGIRLRWHSIGLWQYGWLVGALGVQWIQLSGKGTDRQLAAALVALMGWGLVGVLRRRGTGMLRMVLAVGSVFAYGLGVAAGHWLLTWSVGYAVVVTSGIWGVTAYAVTNPDPDATAGLLGGGSAILFGGTLVLSGYHTGAGAMVFGMGVAVCGGAVVPYVHTAIARGIVCGGLGVSLLAMGFTGITDDYLIFDLALMYGGCLLALAGNGLMNLEQGPSFMPAPGRVGYADDPPAGALPEQIRVFRSDLATGGIVGAIGLSAALAGIVGMFTESLGIGLLDNLAADPAVASGFGLSGVMSRILGIPVLAAAAFACGCGFLAVSQVFLFRGMWLTPAAGT